MKAKVYDLSGKVVEEYALPDVFNAEIRADIIKRAVLSEESKLYQPKGNYRYAGIETSAKYVGRKEIYESLKNRGQAMKPREFMGGGVPGRVRKIPGSVGGRRAHPPKPWKINYERINKKEWLKALGSALAASADPKVVLARGHKVGKDLVPMVVVDDFEKLTKTKYVNEFLSLLAEADLERARNGGKKVTGVRKRKAGKKYPKSALIIVSQAMKAGGNIPGVDVKSVEELKVKDLAPGTLAGRFTVFTKAALKKIDEKFRGGAKA